MLLASLACLMFVRPFGPDDAALTRRGEWVLRGERKERGIASSFPSKRPLEDWQEMCIEAELGIRRED